MVLVVPEVAMLASIAGEVGADEEGVSGTTVVTAHAIAKTIALIAETYSSATKGWSGLTEVGNESAILGTKETAFAADVHLLLGRGLH